MINVELQLPVQTAIIEAHEVRVSTDRAAIEQLTACGTAYRERYATADSTAPGLVDGVQVARTLFRTLGVDPTKTRPSSEALLRRAMKGKPLPTVNSLVDVGNWCSLDFLLPLGLYDIARLSGDVILRRGESGESYRGIGDREIHVADRYVLADRIGPFGSPVADSLRTAVTLETTEALMIIFAPADYDRVVFECQAATAVDRITECCGGRTEPPRLLSGN